MTSTPVGPDEPDAPPLPAGSPSDLNSAVSFLYTGSDPLQQDVQPGSIEEDRTALIYGKAYRIDGEDLVPLPDVRISILNHPEFGWTLTREDGRFDIALNGNSYMTVVYELDGYISAQRTVFVQPQDQSNASDVVLIPYDTFSTAVDLSLPGLKVARGSQQTDDDGSRRATLMFPENTTATFDTPGGAVPVSNLTIRLTEFTVGPNGELAMPAELPPASQYTYAVELSADEEEGAGATGITFDQPLPFYVENFLAFPVGTPAPLGFYDRERAVWVPLASGIVIRIASITSGMADIDVGTDEFGLAPVFSNAERTMLATLYAPGQELWRVEIPHFSIIDINWSGFTGDDMPEQGVVQPEKSLPTKHCTLCPGSLINLENRDLTESIGLTGVPSSLNYASSRAQALNEIPVIVSGAGTLPTDLRAVNVTVHIGGAVASRSFVRPFEFTGAPDQQLLTTDLVWTFEWDGLDQWDRPLSGFQKAIVYIDNLYEEGIGFYGITRHFGGVPVAEGGIIPAPARTGHVLKRFETSVAMPLRGGHAALGGWTFDLHHMYDPTSGTVYLGDGGYIADVGTGRLVRDTIAGHGTMSPGSGSLIVGTTRIEEINGEVGDIAAAADGGFWFSSGGRFLKVDADGVITYRRGVSSPEGPLSGNHGIWDMDVGPGGELYLTVTSQRILKYDPATDELTIFAGDGAGCPGPLTEPAVALTTSICAFPDIAVAPDGNVYITATHVNRVYRISTDGLIHPFALQNTPCPPADPGDPGPLGSWCTWDKHVSEVHNDPNSVAKVWVDREGTVYIRGTFAANLSMSMKIGPDGIVRRWLGGGLEVAPGTEPEEFLGNLFDVEFAPDGSYVFSAVGGDGPSGGGTRVRAVDAAGEAVYNIAGIGPQSDAPWNQGTILDGQPADTIPIWGGGSLAILENGDILYTEAGWLRIFRPTFRGYGDLTDHFIASPDGSEIWRFSGAGRHLETLHGLTGAVLWSFGYDSAGRLTSMTDSSANVTTISRNLNGAPTAIVGPYGAETDLTLDTNGYLENITNPAVETVVLSHTDRGLLTSMTTPEGNLHEYDYDLRGRVEEDANPAGSLQTLTQSEITAGPDSYGGREVTRTTILGRATSTTLEWLKSFKILHTITAPDGTVTENEYTGSTTKSTLPSGAVATSTEQADVRFGVQAPVFSGSIANTPGGLTMNYGHTQSVDLADDQDPFSITSLTETFTINGRSHTSTYDGATRTFTSESAEGRTATLTIDQQGRPTTGEIAGLTATEMQYDSRGRIQTITSGTRVTTFTYDANGYVDTLTDPGGHTVGMDYDTAGRLTRQSLPNGNEIGFSYDDDGNLVSITPPGRPLHTLTYDEMGLPLTYSPPAVSGVTNPETTYDYNLDGQLTMETRPDGLEVTLGYDAAGRLATIAFSRGTIVVNYDPTTGQVTGVSAPGGQTVTYSYLGELLASETWAGPISGSVGYSYDDSFRFIGQTVNGANLIAFTYDDDDLLASAGPLTFERNANNVLLTGTTLGDVTSEMTYNSFAELTGNVFQVNSTAIYSATYTRDNLGRITTKTEVLNGVTTVYGYTYDVMSRLSTVTINSSPSATYTYDANGNRLTGPSAQAGTHDAQDRLLSYAGNTYTYTAAGELISKTNGGDTTEYLFDELSNLITVDLPDGTAIEYLVDGAGRRIGKRVDGNLTQGFLYDGTLAVVAELDGSGVLRSRFVYATAANVPDLAIQDGETYRIVTDHLDSLRLVIRESDGAVVQRMNHDEFGRVTEDFVAAGFDRVPFGFAGGLYDPDTGLVRFGARDYDPESGRWTTKDPIGFGGGDTNLYAYAGNDPVNNSDPSGLFIRLQPDHQTAMFDALGMPENLSATLGAAIDRELDAKAAVRPQESRGSGGWQTGLRPDAPAIFDAIGMPANASSELGAAIDRELDTFKLRRLQDLLAEEDDENEADACAPQPLVRPR